MIISINSLKETSQLAAVLATTLKNKSSALIALNGELGAGKTTFVSCLIKSLGSKEDVSSPTFVLQHEYQCETLKVEHWDMYRLKVVPDEVLEPLNKNTIRIIEWADKFPQEIKPDLTILFSLVCSSKPKDGIEEEVKREVKIFGKILSDLREALLKWSQS